MLATFEKTERLRHIGHLDIMRAMQRALRRSGLPVSYSKGFNPHILLTFASALSVGAAGRCKIMETFLDEDVAPEAFLTAMNGALPPEMQLTGARVVSVRQIGGDRIIHVDLDAVNELGDHVLRRLVLEIMGRHSNLLLLDENDRILEATRHVNTEMSRIRQIQPGMAYLPPPPQDRLAPEDATSENLHSRLCMHSKGTFSKALAETVTGLSRVAAEELACRVLRPGEDWPEDLQDTCRRLAGLFSRLPGMADPRVLFNENGEAEDVFPFP
jgi:predicted ribosome quality control (RQC) complex YloA/Tae2 family protein